MARRFQRSVKKSPSSDPQQNLVYRMENEAIGARAYARLSRRNACKLLRSLCRNYGTLPVRVRFKDMGMWAAEWQAPNVISLSDHKGTALDLLTITHEFAHHLHAHMAPESLHQNHGPQFMACHMSVLDTIRYVPVDAMKVICDRYKVKYLDPGMRQSLARLRKLLAH